MHSNVSDRHGAAQTLTGADATSSIWFIAKAAHLSVMGITQGSSPAPATDTLVNAPGSTVYLQAPQQPARTETAAKKVDFVLASSWKVLDVQAGGYYKDLLLR